MPDLPRFQLSEVEGQLSLTDNFVNQRPLSVDFAQPDFLRRLQQAGKSSELVARAVRAGDGVRVLDCTAGLGRDGFLLAWLGCDVTMLERSGTLYEMLRDGLRRARKDSRLYDAAARIHLVNIEAVGWLRMRWDYDALLIDPMFPDKAGSAQVKGPMQLMQRFLGTDEDATTLLNAARATGCERIVLKRPAKGSWRPPYTPVTTFKSRNGLYEIYSGSTG